MCDMVEMDMVDLYMDHLADPSRTFGLVQGKAGEKTKSEEDKTKCGVARC